MKLDGRRRPLPARVFQRLGGALFTPILIITASLACEGQQISAQDTAVNQAFLQKLVLAAMDRTHHSVCYVSSYVRIPYPGGDVPADTGVCTDEIVRIYRAAGVDLPKEVYEDIVQNFAAYPHRWQGETARPDSNIDHRRVPNLMVFFSRKGESLPKSSRAEAPGDLVTWDLSGGVPHIGMVVDARGSATGPYMIVHNIGAGPKMEDVLFRWKITGHYRYLGPKS